MSEKLPDEETVYFGYQAVSPDEKKEKVAQVFSQVANNYDLMNDLMSFGLHRLWKRIAVELCGVRPGQHILDVAAGSADLSRQFAQLVGSTGTVWVTDINAAMLSVGRDKLIDKGIVDNVQFCQANAEQLPFKDNYFDCVTIGFGLRNVTHIDTALESMHRVLKPGGRLLILEFSKPNAIVNKIYDKYSFSILPLLGRFIAKDEGSYRYLAESIRKHPDQETLLKKMQAAGFQQCQYHNMTGGIVAIHKGFKC